MMVWEQKALEDREKIFEYLYGFNPVAAEKTDDLIESAALNLIEYPEMGVKRQGVRGRLLIVPALSVVLSCLSDDQAIRVMRVLHQRQQFPP
jgi:addiction module RelE/StbE family toxin